MRTRNNCRKSVKWLLATILVAGAAFCAVGESLEKGMKDSGANKLLT